MTQISHEISHLQVAGIAWTDRGFESVVVDVGRKATEGPEFYGPTEISRLCDELANRTLNTELACIVDSSNGMLDERLAAANLTVYRADPNFLPADLQGGRQLSAAALAKAGCEKLSSLAKLSRGHGTLEGRMDEVRLHNGISVYERQLRSDGLCVDSGAMSSKQVFLTFDDGPSPYTAEILEVLCRYEVPATFFCVGLNALGHADLIKEMVRGGHAVGNHTWSHAFSPDLNMRNWHFQLEMTNRILADITGRSCRLFRPPYGARTVRDLKRVTHMGMKTVLWTVDSKDWARPGVQTITDRVVNDTRNGSIILLHDGGGDRSQTVYALSRILSRLKSAGHIFCHVESMFADAQIKTSSPEPTLPSKSYK